MIDTGYLYAKDNKRLFINTSLGCSSKCKYCYLPKLDIKYDETKIMEAETLIDMLENSEYKINIDTLITLGCYSEC